MPDPLADFMEEIRTSRKYEALQLPGDLLRDLLTRELDAGFSLKEARKQARRKLHMIVAPYLGDPDYAQATRQLEGAFASGGPAALKEVCVQLLGTHASTRERLPYLEQFYAALFAVTGRPFSILDLACGLNPLAFPWMNLPLSTRYFAYDIHRPRVDLINQYFQLQGLEPLAEQRDVLAGPSSQYADVAFFFKEAHRLEQRQRGGNHALWQGVRARWLVVSLPSVSLGGHHNLLERQHRLMYGVLRGLPWPVTELVIGSEMVFCIEKSDETKT
ncbi:MAG: hypothetical protein IT308_03970 [Anaerolineaceae bacterium]|nr:hypothetical protein [Anaerolineaceae bacterium]